ncbi:phospholipase A1-like [Ostrinia furnacalis]|nr:phospholipase A1-like [Ostrinia furnacalis]
MATVAGRTYTPKSEVGIPAGLIPECPGVMKNATISNVMVNYLQVVHHRLNDKGEVVRKSMPITTAPSVMAKSKYMDLKNKKTVFYAVGFIDSSWFLHSQAVGTAYAKLGYNVFQSETIAFLTQIYPKSVRLSREIGRKIGEFLVKLTDQGLTADNLELAGISLGAHIVGYAAKHFYSVTGKKPSRVTGLDPAGPCFRSLPSKYRLDSSDAERVDIIHTNIDGFGIAERLGHVDFYANGGEFQPSDVPYVPCLVICSHIRAILYWWQALEHPKKFIAIKCDSIQDARFSNCYNNTEVNYVGMYTDFGKPGIYYLPTNNEFPYYRGKKGLKAENEIYTSIIRNINSEDNFVL